MSRTPRQIFTSACAQDDNLGDMVLRATNIAVLRDAGGRLHVLTAGMTDSYVAGLGLRPGDVVYGGQRSWIFALLRETGRGRSALVFAPGAQSMQRTRSNVFHALGNVLLAVALKAHRCPLVKYGRSFPTSLPGMKYAEVLLSRLCTVYSVRDARSPGVLNIRKLTVHPDIAMSRHWRTPADTSRTVGRRKKVAVSFRMDGDVSEDELRRRVEVWQAQGLDVTLATQVRRDNRSHDELAAKLKICHLAWPDDVSHEMQLGRLLALYGQCEIVHSNRLHALIFGLRMGASPSTPDDRSDIKIRPHLAVLKIPSPIHPESIDAAYICARAEADLTEFHTRVVDAITGAGAQVAE